MISDTLAEASKEVARQRIRIIGFVSAAIAAGLLILIAVGYLRSLPAESAVANTPQPILEPSGHTSELRGRSKELLKMFEVDIEPQLALANLSEWNPETLGKVFTFKDEALSAFSGGDYNKAIDSIGKAETLAKEALAQWEDNFSVSYSAALSLFGEQESDKARLEIEKTLVFKPSDPDALALKQRIDVLPKVRVLLAAARVAKVENNLRKEHGVLTEILSVDPARTELGARILDLEAEMSETDFGSIIQKGFRAVAYRDLQKARSFLARAKNIYPGRHEIRILSDNIVTLVEELKLENALRKGKEAIAQDDWVSALAIFKKAKNAHPNNGYLVDQTAIASKIVSLLNAITDFVVRHQRLSSLNVALSAKKTLNDIDKFVELSPSLLVKANELKKLLGDYDRSVGVVVKSDNKTYISVQGVGKIGMTENKQIQLRPGVYTFEGKRPGFKSKLLDVEIPLNKTSVVVELVCDERI